MKSTVYFLVAEDKETETDVVLNKSSEYNKMLTARKRHYPGYRKPHIVHGSMVTIPRAREKKTAPTMSDNPIR